MAHHQAITSPFPARPPRYSLVLVAEALAGLPPEVLLDGYTYQPEACGVQRVGKVELGCEGNTETLTTGNGATVVEGEPFVVWAWDKCSTFGFGARDWDGRAARMLNATQSHWLASELWVGEMGLAQRSLNDAASTEVTSSAVSPLEALTLLETQLGLLQSGEPGMIHMTLGMLTRLVAEQALRLDGTIWRTASGNVVVADSGYNGAGPGDTDPDAGSEWIYATSMIGVAFGDVITVPGTFAEAQSRAQMIDRSVNDVELYVERTAIWVWDECTHLAAQVSTVFTSGGSGGGLTDAELRAADVVVSLDGEVVAITDNGVPIEITANTPVPVAFESQTVDVEVTLDGEQIVIDEPTISNVDGADNANPDCTLYWGFTFANAHASAAATIRIYDGNDASDPLLDMINLAAGESAREVYAHPLTVTAGELFCDISGGTVTGRLRVS